MPDPYYFQWQNPVLRETIYPMRELKLRDFLLFDYEVELWKTYYPIWQENKDQIPESLRNLVQVTFNKEKSKLQQAVQDYDETLRLLCEDVVLNREHDYLKRIIPLVRSMHQLFRERFEGFSVPRQGNFLRDRIAEFQNLLKEVDRHISNKQRSIRDNGQEWANRNGYQALLDMLSNFTRPMVENELQLLTRFQAAYNRMAVYEQQRKAKEVEWQKKHKTAAELAARIDREVKTVEKKLANLEFEISFFRQIRQVQEVEPHFIESDIKAFYRNEFKRIDQDILDQIQRIHKQIAEHFKQPKNTADFLKGRVVFLESCLRMAPPDSKTAEYRQAIGRKELSKLKEYELAYASREKPAEVQARLQKLEVEHAALSQQLQGFQQKQGGPKGVIEEALRTLKVSRQDQIIALADPSRIRIKDIVEDKLDSYRSELQEKNAEQLLADIVRIFVKNPGKYPLWLQYMVIHFSGMRYKSAHGSWQDPKKLLVELRKQKFLQDADSLEIEQLDDRRALEKLARMKAQVPSWMWHEIVRLTDLKVNEVTHQQWEQLSREEIDLMYQPGSGKLRQALFDWKKVITVWREEHYRTKRLNVTSAVCNEVAEHIQHLRGIKPPGGLTAKPAWYLSEEAKSAKKPDSEQAYFLKPKDAAPFIPGASIFWLRWVRKYPNLAQVTRPLILRSGDPLVPLENTKPKITIDNNDYKRVVNVQDRDARGKIIGNRQEEQWLRWMHESTVVKVVDTAEGTVVYTFETSLPDEPRSLSTMGLSKRYLVHLIHSFPTNEDRGTFVGYVPEGDIPFEPLKEMLDWNQILRRKAFSLEEIRHYWKEVTELKPE
jgi:hypothetical protein